MLLIYTHRITSRNKYIFKLIFGDILGMKHELTNDKAVFQAWRVLVCLMGLFDCVFVFVCLYVCLFVSFMEKLYNHRDQSQHVRIPKRNNDQE